MLIKIECLSTNNSATPNIHQKNLQKHSHSVILLNTCHIEYFVNMCWGWVTVRWGVCTFWAKRLIWNQDEA